MTSFRQEQMIVRVSSEFKPLSVWQKDGYDIELLQAKGEKRTNPVFGDVWAAPLTSVVHENIRGEVEKEIQEKEWTLKEQKKPKRGRAVKATAESSAADAIEVDDEERARSWKVEIGKASKLISQLNNVCNAISVCDAKITKQPDVLEADMKTGFDEVKKQMREWKEQATSLIATSAEKMLAEDPVALPVTVADAVTQIKASQNLLKDVRSSYANEAKAKKAAADVNKTPKAKAAPKAAKSKAAPGKGKR
ncbi:unnamed protein product [Durusdinium trenchii]|uniref:Uncharacterized protein n=1 Tax=Durusdinium trenchii TaxID=1381693 RepID=A0ABP0JC89_9DINO